ncbi:MAG: YwaF family protein [Oscillospiraceae bacterium]|nr:YwaF family protein [Oscillospiraceae bacterium]
MNSFLVWLDNLISATSWEMEVPKAYGTFHILFTVIGFAVCVLLAWRLRKVGDAGNKIVLLSVGLFLLISEVYKQLFYSFYLSDNTYVWWIFPFQLCSVPMYMCLIAPLLKPGKLQRYMYNFMMIYNLLGGAISFTEPSGLLHPYWTLTLHALIWHMLIVFVGLYLAFSGRGGKTMADYRCATVTYLCLCVLAFAINLLLRDISNGSVNMFYVGPSNSPIIVFKQISEHFGWYFSTALYIPAMCLGAYVCFLPIYLTEKKKVPC